MINKIAVVGSRGFDSYSFFAEKLELIISNLEGEIEFVSGGAVGCDSLIRRYSDENGYKITEFLPNYELYPGKVAPLKRNHQIVDYADKLIAFTSGSKGTAYTIKLAEKKGIPIRVITV